MDAGTVRRDRFGVRHGELCGPVSGDRQEEVPRLRRVLRCKALEQRPGTEIITRTLLNYDAAQINEGKHYEMLDCYLGIAEAVPGHREQDLPARRPERLE